MVTDQFWQRVEPLVPQRVPSPDKQYVRKPGAGRPPKPARQVFEGIVYVLRTGSQWKALPAERFGSASAVHKRFLEWEKAGFFESLWRAGLAEYDDMEGITWRWQSVDGALPKAPLAQEAVGPNPTDRGKKGSKRHLLVDGRGVPLSLIVTAANVNDGKRLDAVLSAIIIKRKRPTVRRSKHLCADAGCRSAENLRVIDEHGYIAHVVDRRKEIDIKRRDPTKKARRWVVEVCHGWFNRFRKLLVRYAKPGRCCLSLRRSGCRWRGSRAAPVRHAGMSSGRPARCA